jgi:hypothetical protein
VNIYACEYYAFKKFTLCEKPLIPLIIYYWSKILSNTGIV